MDWSLLGLCIMVRKNIKIDEEKCNDCGICAKVCRDSAIWIIDAQERLVRESFCDGLGAVYLIAM